MAKQPDLLGLTQASARKLQTMLREWNRFPRNVVAQRRNPVVRSTGPQLARTTSTGTYPTRADARNAWEIEFLTVTYTEEAGVQPLTITAIEPPGSLSVAHNIYNDPFVPSGTLLSVWPDNGRWWFEYEDEIQLGVLQGTTGIVVLSAGGSVDVKAQVNGTNAPGGAVVVHDKLGVMAGKGGEKCYFKWNRQHAQYWMIQKECAAGGYQDLVVFELPPSSGWVQPRGGGATQGGGGTAQVLGAV